MIGHLTPKFSASALVVLVAVAACGGRADVTAGPESLAPPPSITGAEGGVTQGPGDASPPSLEDGATKAAADAGHAALDGGTPVDASSPQDGQSPPLYDGGILPAASTVQVLDYEVIDAKFSAALSSLVMVSDTPTNALHIYDVATRVDRLVPLPAAPTSVAVDSTGLMAAVAYDRHVSSVDLSAGVLKTTCATTSDAFQVALSRNGTAYIMPATTKTWAVLHAVDLSSCAETLSSANVALSASSSISLDSKESVVLVDQNYAPNDIYACNLAAPAMPCGSTDNQIAPTAYGARIWLSADGKRLYTNNGVALNLPADLTTGKLTYAGTLGGENVILSLSEALQAHKVALIPGPAALTVDGFVHVHETASMGLVAQYAIPPFPFPPSDAGTARAQTDGQFVFTTPTMDALYVIERADNFATGTQNKFAIATIVP